MRRKKIFEHRIFEIPQTSLKADYFLTHAFFIFQWQFIYYIVLSYKPVSKTLFKLYFEEAFAYLV